MKFVKILSLFLISVIFIRSHSLAQDVNSQEPIIIVASINPIYQILLAITEDKKNTILIINPRFSEHGYQLKKSDAGFFSKANLIFYIDDSLEINFYKLIKNFKAESHAYKLSSIEDLTILQRRGRIKERDMHIWLNPENAIKIAQFMTLKISELDPKNAKKYQKNLLKFQNTTLKTIKIINKEALKIKDKKYIFYHDGYQYFENYFAIKPVKVISYDHFHDLTLQDVREMDMIMDKGEVKCIFGEPQDEKNSAIKLSQNYRIKFSILDLIGSKENYGSKVDGYNTLLRNMANDIVGCVL